MKIVIVHDGQLFPLLYEPDGEGEQIAEHGEQRFRKSKGGVRWQSWLSSLGVAFAVFVGLAANGVGLQGAFLLALVLGGASMLLWPKLFRRQHSTEDVVALGTETVHVQAYDTDGNVIEGRLLPEVRYVPLPARVDLRAALATALHLEEQEILEKAAAERKAAQEAIERSQEHAKQTATGPAREPFDTSELDEQLEAPPELPRTVGVGDLSMLQGLDSVQTEGIVNPEPALLQFDEKLEGIWLKSALSKRESALARRIMARYSYYWTGKLRPISDVLNMMAGSAGAYGQARKDYKDAIQALNTRPSKEEGGEGSGGGSGPGGFMRRLW